jgi:hypothetical protein
VSALDIASYLPQKAGGAHSLGVLPATDEMVPWNLPIKHWSPSSFSMLQRCPRQWQERYVKGKKSKPAEAPFVGTTIHAAEEMNFGQKIQSHDDIPTAQLLEFYEDTFPLLLEREQEKSGSEMFWDTSLDDARSRGKLMLASYHNFVAPRIQPLAVETVISVDMGLPVPVEGRFDIEREESVIDLKSGKRATYKPKEDWLIQAAVYGAARNKLVEFHSISATEKTSKVTIVTPLESEEMLVNPTLSERAEQTKTLRALSEMACFYMATFGPDEPWPTFGRFHNWACSFCGFRGDCPAWAVRP